MSGDVGAEVAAVLAEHRVVEHHTTEGRWVCENPECIYETWDWTAIEEHYAEVLAPLIAVRVEAAKAEALREAADEMVRLETKSAWDLKAACERGARNTAYYVGMDDAYSHAGDILRVRAAALDAGPRP